MLPTPSTSHVNYDHIYEPAEDSFLILDTLSSATETKYLQARFGRSTSSTTPLVLEVGTGSGVVLAFITAHARHLFNRPDVATLGVDINHFASAATAETIRNATAAKAVGSSLSSIGLASSMTTTTTIKPTTPSTRTPFPARTAFFLDAFVGDLASSVRPRTVDVLVFNPPYVPSEHVPAAPANAGPNSHGEANKGAADQSSFERDSHLLYLSTDGGVDGMEVTERLLGQLPDLLSDRGVAYILLCAQNKPEAVMTRIRAWTDGDQGDGGWEVDRVGSSGQKAGWERLCIIRIARVKAR